MLRPRMNVSVLKQNSVEWVTSIEKQVLKQICWQTFKYDHMDYIALFLVSSSGLQSCAS